MMYFAPDQSKCYWCDCTLDWDAKKRGLGQEHTTYFPTRDHIVPRSEGGKQTVWACYACNQLKGDMPPVEWAMLLTEFRKNKVSVHSLCRMSGPQGMALLSAARESGVIE